MPSRALVSPIGIGWLSLGHIASVVNPRHCAGISTKFIYILDIIYVIRFQTSENVIT